MLPHVSKPAKSHYWKVVKERPTFRVQPDERRNADGSHRFPFGVPLCKGKAGGPPMGGWLTVGYSVYVNHGAGHDPGQKQWHVTRAAVTTFNFFTRIFVAQRSFSKQGCLKKTKRPKKHIQCVLLHTTWVWLNPHTHNEVQLCKVNWYQRWWLNQPRKWRPPLTFMRVGGFSLQLTRTCSCPLNTFNMTRRGQAFKSSIRRSVSFLALAPWTSRSLSAKTYSLIVRWAYNPTCQGKKMPWRARTKQWTFASVARMFWATFACDFTARHTFQRTAYFKGVRNCLGSIYISLSFEKPFWNCICVSFDGICRKEANGKAKVEASKRREAGTAK